MKLVVRNPISRSRAGSSLIEMIVMLSVSSTLLVIAVGWIHQSFRLASVLRGHERHHQSLVRLSRQFRDDAHAARAMDGDRSEAVFTVEDTLVRYEIDGSVVRRTLLSESSDTIRGQETYELRDQAAVTLDLDESPLWISLIVHRNQPSESMPEKNREQNALMSSPLDLAVRAAVGRWNVASSDSRDASSSGETP